MVLTMNPRIRKLAVLVGSTALLGGAVAGCGSSSSTGSASASSGTATTAQAQAGPNGGPGGMLSTANLKTLATKLGVTTTALQKAMQSARPSGAPSSTAPSSQTDPQAQMAAALAKALNLDEAKVVAALKAVMPAAPSGTPPQSSGTTASS
jgi:hypothetical protein